MGLPIVPPTIAQDSPHRIVEIGRLAVHESHPGGADAGEGRHRAKYADLAELDSGRTPPHPDTRLDP